MRASEPGPKATSDRTPRSSAHRLAIALTVGCAAMTCASSAAAQATSMQQRLSRYIDQRFGMFIHYNMDTYLAVSQPKAWAENRVDPKTFAPPDVDCHTLTDPWAAAAKSAGMKFGILTTKHHDGFALWPSKAVPPSSTPSTYNRAPYTIAQSAVPTMDLVQCYVDSFRAAGLDANLYFSIWDPNNGVGSQSGHYNNPGVVSWSVIENYVVTQLTELLTNYGEIPLIAFDGYSWLTGHQEVPYQQIHALVRQLQPNAIILDHNGGVPWEVDTEYFEEPLGITVPAGNTTAGSQGQTIATDNQWFWSSTSYRTAQQIAAELAKTEPNYTTFILNCPPNVNGVLDSAVVTALGQVPQYWTPNASRAPLPAQLPKIDIPLTAVSATATSGNAALAVDGLNDSSKGPRSETLWTSTGALPQSITIDLGQVYANIDMLEYLPQRWTGTTNGNVTSYTIYASTDGSTFTKATTGTWPAGPVYNGLLSPQRVQFAAQRARYVKFEVDAVAGAGTQAIVGELAVGSSEAAEGDGGADGGGGGSADAAVNTELEASSDAKADGRVDDASIGARDATVDSGGDSRAPAKSDGGENATVDAGFASGADARIVDTGFADVYLRGEEATTVEEASADVLASSDGEATDSRSPVGTSDEASGDDASSSGAASPTDGGCSCSVGPDRGGPWGGAMVVSVIGLVLAGRRRRVDKRRG